MTPDAVLTDNSGSTIGKIVTKVKNKDYRVYDAQGREIFRSARMSASRLAIKRVSVWYVNRFVVCINICMCVCDYVYVCVCIRMCVYLYMYTYIYVCICLCLCLCLRMRVCVRI